jgi:hypothetical protein
LPPPPNQLELIEPKKLAEVLDAGDFDRFLDVVDDDDLDEERGCCTVKEAAEADGGLAAAEASAGTDSRAGRPRRCGPEMEVTGRSGNLTPTEAIQMTLCCWSPEPAPELAPTADLIEASSE